MCPGPAKSIKMVLVGDSYVGKTSLAQVFVHDHFRETYSASVGGHFVAKTLENPPITLQIWDTAGMERFRSMLPHFMRGAQCAFIVYDISNRETFISVRDYWINYVRTCGPENVVKVLVGNKSDCLRHVAQSEARELASFHHMLFFETSAKYGINVEKMFSESATEVTRTISTSVELESSGVHLEILGSNKKSKCCSSS